MILLLFCPLLAVVASVLYYKSFAEPKHLTGLVVGCCWPVALCLFAGAKGAIAFAKYRNKARW